ncbi:VNG_1110C family protein [Natrialbaceae archaeon A-gly3]
MPEPSRLRDSTQIVLPWEAIADLEAQLEARFTVTLFDEGEGYCRIIGSPVEIKEVSDFLARQGVSLR